MVQSASFSTERGGDKGKRREGRGDKGMRRKGRGIKGKEGRGDEWKIRNRRR